MSYEISNEPAPDQDTNLSIADIGFLIQIIEVCSQRGAFRAEELASVGTVYNKVKAFVVANTPAEPIVNQPTEEINQ
jgi:hypothetical protein